MDDTAELQGPPLPTESAPQPQTETHVKPVTAAPPPPESAPTDQSRETMLVPEFAKQLQTDQTRQEAGSNVPPAPHVPAWREQLPVASVAILLGAMLVGWSLWQRRKLLKQQALKPAAARSMTIAESQQLQRDVADLTEKLAHQLDVRAARLEKMLEQADQRIATMEKLLAAKPAPVMIEPKPRSSTPLQGLDTPALQHRDVYALADEGLTPVQIAQRLSKPTGQIELILNLRKASLV